MQENDINNQTKKSTLFGDNGESGGAADGAVGQQIEIMKFNF